MIVHTTSGRYRSDKSIMQSNGWLTLVEPEQKVGAGKWVQVNTTHFPPDKVIRAEETK